MGSRRRQLILGGCFKMLTKHPSKFQLIQYKKALYKIRNIIKRRKMVNFNEFIDSLDPNSSSKNFWKIIKLFRNSEFFSSEIPPTTGKADLVGSFVNSFAPCDTRESFFDTIFSRYPSFFDTEF